MNLPRPLVMLSLLASTAAAQTPLPAVNVDASKPTAKRAGFEERLRQGHGRFVTLEQIQKQEHKRFSDIVGQIPGAMVTPNGTASGMVVASSRGVQSVEAPPGGLRAMDPNAALRPVALAGIAGVRRDKRFRAAS